MMRGFSGRCIGDGIDGARQRWWRLQLAAMMEPIVGRSLGGDDLEPFTLSLLEWFRTLGETDVAEALAAFL
tara:strand:- start:39765 stop:39977 length:213 start_codon:yes stop_codon:yes gene_type:complete